MSRELVSDFCKRNNITYRDLSEVTGKSYGHINRISREKYIHIDENNNLVIDTVNNFVTVENKKGWK